MSGSTHITQWGRLIAAVPLFCFATAHAAEVERRLGMMGTELTVTVRAPERAAALAASELAVRALDAAESRLSTWRHDSELWNLNQAPSGTSFPLSATLAVELSDALACAAQTGGAFDPTVGALVEVWDLRGQGRIPAADELADARHKSGHASVSIEAGRAVKAGDVIIEEGAFGKGAGLRAAVHALVAAGVTSATLNLGGQTAGLQPDTIPIAHPDRRGEPAVMLKIDAGSFSTSGDSERKQRVGTEVIGHLLDPRSGRPARDFGTLGVWSADPLWADCLSTALFVLGPEGALAWAKGRTDAGVLVLERAGGRVRARTAGRLAGRVTWSAPGIDVVH